MRPEHETCNRAYNRQTWIAQPAWVSRDSIREVYREARRRGLTVDHIVPLRGEGVCGLHVPWNMRLVDAVTNFAQGNRTWPGMPFEQMTFIEHEPHQCALL